MSVTASKYDFGPVALFRTRHVTVTTFGMLVGLGFFVALMHFWFYLGYRQVALHDASLVFFGLLISLAAPVGAYSMARLLDLPRLIRGEVTLAQFFRIPGFALWGGLLLGMAVIYILSRANGWNPLVMFDGVVFGLPLAQAIGRLGCLNYGCCHGRPHPKGRGIRYHDPETKVLRLNGALAGVPLYPTQIYSSLANVGIYLILLAVALVPESPTPGMVTALYLLMYGTKRLALELLRGEWPRTNILGLSLWQWFSLGFIAAGAFLLGNLEPGLLRAVLPSVGNGLSLARNCFPITAAMTLGFTAIYALQGRTIGSW